MGHTVYRGYQLKSSSIFIEKLSNTVDISLGFVEVKMS